MSLETDAILDRRRLKRSILRWRIAAVLALALAGLGGLYVADPGGLLRGGDYVARIKVEGVIAEDEWIEQQLATIADDDRAKALVVMINSPGGSTFGGEALYLSLRKVGEEKPVAAVIGTLGASAGYMAALAGDRIFARETSITGSIGVLFQTAEFSKLLDKIGVSAESITSGPLKDEPSMTRPMSERGRKAIRDMVDETHRWFVGLVAERRQMPREKAALLADGRVYTGRSALASGLIDQLGGEAEARQWLEDAHQVSTDLPIRDFDPEPPSDRLRDLVRGSVSGVFREMAQGMAQGLGAALAAGQHGKSLFTERLRLDGLVSVWQADAP